MIELGKRKPKEYKVTVIKVEISEKERIEQYEAYKELLYKLLFTNQYRKSKEDKSNT